MQGAPSRSCMLVQHGAPPAQCVAAATVPWSSQSRRSHTRPALTVRGRPARNVRPALSRRRVTAPCARACVRIRTSSKPVSASSRSPRTSSKSRSAMGADAGAASRERRFPRAPYQRPGRRASEIQHLMPTLRARSRSPYLLPAVHAGARDRSLSKGRAALTDVAAKWPRCGRVRPSWRARESAADSARRPLHDALAHRPRNTAGTVEKAAAAHQRRGGTSQTNLKKKNSAEMKKLTREKKIGRRAFCSSKWALQR